MNRIICIGNALIAHDSVGPRVYRRLSRTALPDGLELVDGGLGGLNLLPFLDGARRVVFVDSISGFGSPNEVRVLEAADAIGSSGSRYDHTAGLGYLLETLPFVCDEQPPEVFIVGVEGAGDDASLDQASLLSVEIAMEGYGGDR